MLGRLLDGVEKVHCESETVFCYIVQVGGLEVGGGGIDLF